MLRPGNARSPNMAASGRRLALGPKGDNLGRCRQFARPSRSRGSALAQHRHTSSGYVLVAPRLRAPNASPVRGLAGSAAAALLASTALTFVAGAPALATTFTVTDQATLATALSSAVNGDTIKLANTIALTSDLPAVVNNVTIDGQGNTLNGGGVARGLFVYSGTVAIGNLTISNALAQGGAGGNGVVSGGGGAGLGSGLFIAAGANVTVSNVAIQSNVAKGGPGAIFVASSGTGGGGGLGGNGGTGNNADGGGGGVGKSATGGAGGVGNGGPGILTGAAAGGSGGSGGGVGGTNGGGRRRRWPRPRRRWRWCRGQRGRGNHGRRGGLGRRRWWGGRHRWRWRFRRWWRRRGNHRGRWRFRRGRRRSVDHRGRKWLRRRRGQQRWLACGGWRRRFGWRTVRHAGRDLDSRRRVHGQWQ